MVKPKIKEITALTVVLFIVFSVYISTMHPVYKNNDSPETTAAAATLGIGHAPGYPLYTMAGKIAVLVPLANPAFRMNIFSSFLALLALLATYYILVNIIPGNFGQKRVYAAACLFILAFSGIFWNQAIEAKGGIYILNLLFLALLILLSLKLFERFRPVYLYLMAYVFGLSLSNHWPSMIILLPVFGWVFVKYRRKFTVEKAAVSGVLFLLGLTPYLYLFLR